MNGEWNGHIEVATLMGVRMVMLRRWPVYWRKYGHVTEVASLMEGACYGGGQFDGGRMVMLQPWLV